MSNFSFDTDSFLRNLDWTDQKVRNAAERGMNDVVDELVRVSADIAPHDAGILDKPSAERSVKWQGDTVIGEVVYSIKESNKKGKHWNYAQWTHEDPNYKYGEGTLAKSGTQGWSGQHYEPGRKYLERPLLGEAKAFYDHIAKEIKKEVGS